MSLPGAKALRSFLERPYSTCPVVAAAILTTKQLLPSRCYQVEQGKERAIVFYLTPLARFSITLAEGSCFNTPSVVSRPVWLI